MTMNNLSITTTMRTSFVLLFVFAAALAGPVRAQDALAREPGYVDLMEVERWFDRDAKIEVNVQGPLLKLVAEASKYEDPELARMLHKIKAVQVRGYDMHASEFANIEERASQLSNLLKQRGWDTVARVRDREERVEMFVKVNGDAITGMMVMVMSPDEDETIFVNIVGEIDPEQIGRLGGKFGVTGLD